MKVWCEQDLGSCEGLSRTVPMEEGEEEEASAEVGGGKCNCCWLGCCGC